MNVSNPNRYDKKASEERWESVGHFVIFVCAERERVSGERVCAHIVSYTSYIEWVKLNVAQGAGENCTHAQTHEKQKKRKREIRLYTYTYVCGNGVFSFSANWREKSNFPLLRLLLKYEREEKNMQNEMKKIKYAGSELKGLKIHTMSS